MRIKLIKLLGKEMIGILFLSLEERREEKGARGQRHSPWSGGQVVGSGSREAKGSRGVLCSGSARLDASLWGPGCRNPAGLPSAWCDEGTV